MEKFSVQLDSFDAGLKPKCPFRIVKITIDVSGSTNNARGRGRGRVGSFQNQFDQAVQTKVIYLAEMESISLCMTKLANHFDMEGVHLTLSVFSTNYHQIKKDFLKSSKELYDMASVLDELSASVMEFGGTNLTNALEQLFQDHNDENTLFILASDGCPDNKMTSVYQLMNIVKQYKQKEKMLDVFCIGAGSIQE